MPKLRTLQGLAREGYFDFLAPRSLARLSYLYGLDRRRRGWYRELDERELLATRTSDTAFVFGSGRSLVDIAAEQWEAIGRCQTISLREFPRQSWVRADYHVTSEADFLEEYARRIRDNPLYASTVFAVQEGFRAERGNELVGRRLLPRGARVVRYRRNRRRTGPPSSRLANGLVHGSSSIFDATNLGYLLGFSRIVLAGVDLYNKEYFWLEAGQTRDYERPGTDPSAIFIGAAPIVSLMADWYEWLGERGVELSTYNPRSLLAERLPLFSW